MKRKGNGEGTVWKTKSGTWRGQMMVGYTEEGKKRVINVSAPTKAEVLDKLREYQNQRDANIHLDKALSFGTWATMWIEDYKTQIGASTLSGYKYTLRLLKQKFGDAVLSDIMPIHINAFLDELVEKGYSVSLIRKCRTMLIQIFDAADANGLVMRNPARHTKKIIEKRISGKTGKKDAFTKEEVEILLRETPDDLLGNSICLMLGTGLRVQELLALRRDDITDDGSRIRVDKAIKMVDGIPTLGEPKSNASCRTIPVPEKYRRYAIFLRRFGGEPLLWSSANGHPYYSVGCFRHRYYTALRKIESVRKLTPHCCRHTYITTLQAKGVPLETIAKLVGHTDITTTRDYTHISLDTMEKAVAMLDEKERV